MTTKGIETSGASADTSAKLCTDRPATVEEVTSLVSVTGWRSSRGWDESYEPLPVWCSHKRRSKTRTELLFLRMEKSKQRYQNKSRKSRASTTEGPKATKPALGPVTLSTAWRLLPLFVAGQPREATFDQYPSATHQVLADALKKGPPFPDQANRSQQFSHSSALTSPGQHSIWWASKTPPGMQRFFLRSWKQIAQK